jgi:kumamolisin
MLLRPYLRPRAATGDIDTSWDMRALCAQYQWPSGLTGGGTIALIELGGGWSPADMAHFCALNQIPVPVITDRLVNGATRGTFGVDANSDGEVALDLQVSAAAYSIATGKPATIHTYWCANEVAAIEAGVRAALADGCDVCSISWGADEALWDPLAAMALDQAITSATAGGMVVFAAAGDNDSSDGGPNPANVDLPAGCSDVLACGGTTLLRSGVQTVWNNNPGQTNGDGTGGGYSTLLPVQDWQIGAPPAPPGLGRMVPDVAANADPDTGYNIVIGGQVVTIGGTSAVAPLYAGLFAAFGRKLGWIGPALWHYPGAFRDITEGGNGAYQARVGPDPCTGLGSPIGTRLATLFGAK